MAENKKIEIKSGAKTEKRDSFAKYLVKGYEQKEAFRKAGFTSKDATTEASRLKSQPDVKIAYNYYAAKMIKPLNISNNSIVSKVAAIASFNIKKLLDPKTGEPLPPHKLPWEVAEAVSAYKKIITKEETTIHEYKFYDKTWALDKLKEYKSALIEEENRSNQDNSPSRVQLKINGLNIPIKSLKEIDAENKSEGIDDQEKIEEL